jgi:hypothetical protein
VPTVQVCAHDTIRFVDTNRVRNADDWKNFQRSELVGEKFDIRMRSECGSSQ